MWTPWKAYVKFANDKGEALYIKFHGGRRWRAHCKAEGIRPYKQRPFKMLADELRQQAEYQAETQRLAMLVRQAMASGLSESDAVNSVQPNG